MTRRGTAIQVEIERSGMLDAAASGTWLVVSDVARYAELVPHVVDYYQDDGGWRWILEGDSPAGVIRASFTASYDIDEGACVRFDSIERNRRGQPIAQGTFRVVPDGGCTRLTVSLRIEAELPVPALLAGPARRFVVGELRDIADGFIDNVRDELRTP